MVNSSTNTLWIHFNASLIASLSDYQVRDLNDEINKLLREKSHWERRIRQLGGAIYAVSRKDYVIMDLFE